MDIRKKFNVFFVVILVVTTAGIFLFNTFLGKKISSFTSELGGSLTDGFMSAVPEFQSGFFSEDGRYFVYTYRPDVEMPDVDASITIRGVSFPSYFQVMDCQTGEKVLKQAFDVGKHTQLYVIWEEAGDLWLGKVEDGKMTLALFDLKTHDFRYRFGELEKLNPAVDWRSNHSFYINNTAEKGLLLEGNDKRYYRIEPATGKAVTIKGDLKAIDYNAPRDFQVSLMYGRGDFGITQINGRRESIVSANRKVISQDDFIEVKFLTLSKNKTGERYDKMAITYYKDFFFVLSPTASDNKVDMELSMLNKNSLKTVWKVLLPQKTLKTIIPTYGNERFCVNGDELLVANNNYLMSIDLSSGKMKRQQSLYE